MSGDDDDEFRWRSSNDDDEPSLDWFGWLLFFAFFTPLAAWALHGIGWL